MNPSVPAPGESVDAQVADVPRLVLYYREGCHLCEDMEHLLYELLEPGSFQLDRVDIDDAGPLIRDAYDVRVPVLSLKCSSDEQELCEHFLDLQAVTDALSPWST